MRFLHNISKLRMNVTPCRHLIQPAARLSNRFGHLSFAFSSSNALNAIGQIERFSITPINRDVNPVFSK